MNQGAKYLHGHVIPGDGYTPYLKQTRISESGWTGVQDSTMLQEP